MPGQTPDNLEQALGVPERTAELIVRYLDRNLPEQELAELRAALKQSTAARDLFVRWGVQTQALAEVLVPQYSESDSPVSLDQLLEMEANAPAELVHLDPHPARRKARVRDLDDRENALAMRDVLNASRYLIRHAAKSKPAKQLYAYAAIAAVLLLAFALFNPFANNETPTDAPLASEHTPNDSIEPGRVGPVLNTPVATLTATHNATWAEGALAPGSELHPNQRLTLTAGFAEITTNDGAIAILEAPATIELTDNPNAIRLHEGKLVGLCHTELSKGFVVHTDHADITDLGTEFGIQATSAGVQASVFVGEIAIKTPSAPSKVITRDQTARLTVENGKSSLVVEEQVAQGFARRMPRSQLVESVELVNAQGVEAVIVPQGFYASAMLYTDRSYTARATEGRDLPEALLGADIVRMPVALRQHPSTLDNSLEVTLTLARPAEIYVLVPLNAHPADWLAREYERTDMRVALDPSPTERPCVVWQRKQPASGAVVVARGLLKPDSASGMYTLLVAPAEPK